MLHAITERLSKEHQLDPKFVYGRNYLNKKTDELIRRNGLFKKFEFQRYRLPLEKVMHQKRLDPFGLVKEESVQVILDAGGFQFGDQWVGSNSVEKNQEIKNYYQKYKERGAKIIFLPQAFGPFKEKLSKEQINIVFENADLMYARDPISFQYLTEIFGNHKKIKQAPDFTILLHPDINLSLYQLVKDAVCIVPNAKMVSHTSTDVANNYYNFLVNLTKFFIEKGEKVVLLNHESVGDYKIMSQISESVNNQVVLLNELNALQVKAVIGHTKLLISSRFHGVVSGLNQQVPTFCTSWSHKYDELLKLYGCSNAILDVNANIDTTLQQISERSTQVASNDRLAELKGQVNKMWKDIIDLIN